MQGAVPPPRRKRASTLLAVIAKWWIMQAGAVEDVRIEARNNITATTDEDGRQVIQRIAAGSVRLPMRPGRRPARGLLPCGFGRSPFEVRGAGHDS